MDNAETVIAVNDRLDYYSDGIDIVNFIERFTADVHLSVYSVDALYSALDLAAGDKRVDALLYLLDYALEKLLARRALRVEIIVYFLIGDRIKADNSPVLKLLFYRSDT